MNANTDTQPSTGKALLREIIKAVMPAAHGLDGLDGPAERVAAKYGLPNPHFLGNILGTIQAYMMLYQDGAAMDREQRAKLNKVRARLIIIKRACQEIIAAKPDVELGGALLATERGRDIFHVLELHTAVHAFAITDVGPLVDPRDAVLAAFVIPLGEYWLDGTGDVPSGQFGSAAAGYAPVRGTAAEFVMEALSSAGWAFSTERVAVAFAAMQRDLIDRFGIDDDEGDLDDNEQEDGAQAH